MEEGQPQVHNQGPVQGQNIAQSQQITQNFYGPGSLPMRSAPPDNIWRVPYRRNPFFTGREQLLTHLHNKLTHTATVALTQAHAISGLGGIGKTQTAVEYAYRYRDEYHFVLWVNAATRDTIITSFVDLAALFTLPEQHEHDQQNIVAAVKDWFSTHDHWLLILDNADDLALAEEFLPAGEKGHLLLTTRAHAPGTLANGMAVEEMDLEESMLLLLRRARVLAPDGDLDQVSAQDRAAAQAIAQEMDGLPLALDQAGAYMEETQCSLASYLAQYRTPHSSLLHRRGGTGKQHPEPVATTWALSFAQVEKRSPPAADLLRFCAFLAPAAIPEQLIRDGASELSASLQAIAAHASLFDEAIGTLLRFSFVKRNRDEHTLSVHRLVQTIMRSSLESASQRTWAERTVRAIHQAFPDVSDYRNWSRCQHYLPHAQECARLIDHWALALPEAGSLLNQIAYYLEDRAQYEQAEPLYQRALAIREQMLGPEHPDTATSLNNLAFLYHNQGKYEQAEPLYQRALAIYEQRLGPEHPSTRTFRENYAGLLRQMEREGNR